MSLNQQEYASDLAVRPDDIDLFGHVHSAKYLDYFLAARFDQMERCYGFGMGEYLAQGLGWYLQDSQISYKRPLKMGDTITIFTHIVSIERTGCIVAFRMINKSSNKLSCEGNCKFALIELNSQKAIPVPQWIIDRHSKIENLNLEP